MRRDEVCQDFYILRPFTYFYRKFKLYVKFFKIYTTVTTVCFLGTVVDSIFRFTFIRWRLRISNEVTYVAC